MSLVYYFLGQCVFALTVVVVITVAVIATTTTRDVQINR